MLSDTYPKPVLSRLKHCIAFVATPLMCFFVTAPTGAQTLKLLGSTNQGELVEIDVDAGTANLLGSAPGRGWTDLAVDPAGNLYTVSRVQAEQSSVCFGFS